MSIRDNIEMAASYTLTESDVRRIIREELARPMREYSYTPQDGQWLCECGTLVADRAIHAAWHHRTD